MGRKKLLSYCRRVDKYSLHFWVVRFHLRLCDNQTWWMEMVVENRQRQQPFNWTRIRCSWGFIRLVLKPATFETYIVNLKDNYCAVQFSLPTLVFVFVFVLLKHAANSWRERECTLCALTVANRIHVIWPQENTHMKHGNDYTVGRPNSRLPRCAADRQYNTLCC